MKNPVRRIKEEKGLTNREIAILLEQSVANVSHLLNGHFNFIPEKTLNVFEELGYNKTELQKEYKRYRKSEQRKITESFEKKEV
jgi:transcriptional regulator with XRE-family HTH domain